MRVLITGIDGFVGSHLADLLVSLGNVEIHGTVNRSNEPLRNIAHLRHRVVLHQADVTDARRVASLVKEIRPDRILHIAGQAFVPASVRDPMGTFQVNLLGGLSVLEAVREHQARTGRASAVLIVSSGEVYGAVSSQRLPVTEDAPISPTNPYAASKAGLDLIAQQYARTFGVDVIIVRPFNHAGPRQSPAFVVSDFARQFALIALGNQEPVIHVGNIDVERDFTDVRDVVRAYWGLFERRTQEIVFNVASNRTVCIREILTQLGALSGLDVQIRQEKDRIRPYDVPAIRASHERLTNATGWTPSIPFRQTLEDVYHFWLETLRTPATAAVPPST
jgi:GDP-4-dehydro-6-deoxy-D-mannose reductase